MTEKKEASAVANATTKKREKTKKPQPTEVKDVEKKLPAEDDAAVDGAEELPEPDIVELVATPEPETVEHWQKKAKARIPDLVEEELVGEKTPIERELALWKPKTTLGMKVRTGELNSIDEVLASNLPLCEVEIIDKFLPDTKEEIIGVGRVQRVTDSGRRMRFRVITAVGNGNGYIGIGEAKGKEAGPTIRKAIERAKLSIKSVKRGCGSWRCGCGKPHTVPFKISGKSGSVTVTLVPAPRGAGIVGGEVAKKILALAGIQDVWVMTDGHTRTNINFAHAVVNALINTNFIKLNESEIKNLKIVSGKA